MDSRLIVEIANKVFPPGSELVWKDSQVQQKNRFFIIPGEDGPRWIVPRNPRHGLPVLRKWRPYRLSSRLKWAALMVGYRIGRLSMVPGVVAVGVSEISDSNWGHLGWTNERHPVPVVYVGTPSPTRKAVAHLVDVSKYQPVAVAKIPLGVRSAENILHEADILESLDGEKPGIGPRIRYVDRVTGISLQDSITGPASSRHLTQTHMDWLAGLHRPGVETSMREQSEALFKRLVELEGPEERRHHVLENLLERLDDPTPLPALWVHGDFAPWNLKWAKEGRLAAVDWEEARPSGLPTIDLVHFHIIQEFLFSDKEPTETWQLLQKILNSRLVRSYFRILRIADKHLTTPLVLFALAELLSRRRVTVNGASDQFGRYLLNLIETSSPWKI